MLLKNCFTFAMLGLAVSGGTRGLEPATAPTETPLADWKPSVGVASPKIKSLAGATVWIMNRVDLHSEIPDSTSLETDYLREMLRRNGAKVPAWRTITDVKRGDVLVIGEPLVQPLPAQEKDDPAKVQQYEESRAALDEYKLNIDKWVTDVTAAGATVVQPNDAATYFGLDQRIQPDLKRYRFQLLGQAMNRPIPEAQFKRNAFNDVIAYVREVSGLNIEVDWGALKSIGIGSDSPVTATIARQPLSEVLALIIPKNNNGTGAVIADSGGLYITTPERAQNMVLRSPGQWLRLPDLRDPPPAALAAEMPLPAPLVAHQSGMVFYSSGIADVLDYLQEQSGVKVEADWPALLDLGIRKDTPVTAVPPSGPMLFAFRRVVASLPGDDAVLYLTKAGSLRVTKRDWAKAAEDKATLIEP